MYKKLLFLVVLMQAALVYGYDKPNSIAYYPKTGAYFISNLMGKTITRLDSNFNKTDVITGLTRPKDILFATFGPYNGLLILDSNEVKVYDADGYSFIASFKVPGAMDLEDAEEDKTTTGIFYMSDPLANKIFKVVVGPAPFYTPTFTTLNATVRHPKAMLFDSKSRLLVTTDTAKSSVYVINTYNGAANWLATTTIDNINSIEEDIQGNFYATSWGDSYFYRLDKNFKNAEGLALYSKPAGLYFNKTYDVVVLACSNCNKVEFHKLHMVYINDMDTATCPGDSFNVNINMQYKGKGTYNAGNTFYVELSDGSGKFSGGIIIGSTKTTLEPSGYRVALPHNKRFYGSNYKIRIRSTNPAFYSLNEMEAVVPYVPVISINAKDTVLFCNPSNLSFGVRKDIDSGYVNYLWYENGTKLSNALPVYENKFTTQATIKLIKSSLIEKCLVSDSVVLIPSSQIEIPFKDTVKACEGSWIKVGGDSISNTKIEWSSKNYPNIKTDFNPAYQLNSNDTFWVKVTSLTGSCSSQKTIIALAKPKPDYIDVINRVFKCNINSMSFNPIYIKGDRNNLRFLWNSGIYVDDSTHESVNFFTLETGDLTLKFVAMDTVYHCHDSLVYGIRNIESPKKPILGKNSNGVVIKNYDSRFHYKWFKDNNYVVQTTKDSQFVVPTGGSKWGTYKITVTNSDSVDCSDTSNLFTLTDPGSVNKINTSPLSVYPNPANDKLFIKNFRENLERSKVSVYDMIGQIVLEANLEASGEINISSLMSGIYSVRVNFEGRIFITSFIKQ